MGQYFTGLMSGTSIDACDCAIVDFSGTFPKLIHAQTTTITAELKKRIIALQTPQENELQEMLELNNELGELFANAVNECLLSANISKKDIIAIGSHGQTIRHQPDKHYSLQIGNPNIIAQQTGITTVADFRSADMIANGQGAPLLPAFHSEVFASSKINRCIVNIGGMANITILPQDSTQQVTGYDTGTGNVLMDYWINKCLGSEYDADGRWSEEGEPDSALMDIFLQEPYFSLAPPKSTGRELFNGNWLEEKISTGKYSNEIIQATLCKLTSKTITDSILKEASIAEVYCCGGGTYNRHLMSCIAKQLDGIPVQSTDVLGVAPEWVEAMAFAWFAMKRLKNETANKPSVTGAERNVVLGGIFHP